jgi:GT2 family glycosyltransferase
MNDYCITFACLNQLDYTKQLIDSLDRSEIDFSRIIAVDNGSTDGTFDWLSQQGLGGVIANQRNLGCGVAWNQGALALQSTWTIVMNNDIVCHPGWLDNLLATAEKNQIKIASPAMIEGSFDYDFSGFATKAQQKMRGYIRQQSVHAVCMAIHEDVWFDIGYFASSPRLWGYEDALFFRQARINGVPRGTIADSWIHYHGSITQKALKLDKKNPFNTRRLSNLDKRKALMRPPWFDRKINKFKHKRLIKKSCHHEVEKFGHSVIGWKSQQGFLWR